MHVLHVEFKRCREDAELQKVSKIKERGDSRHRPLLYLLHLDLPSPFRLRSSLSFLFKDFKLRNFRFRFRRKIVSLRRKSLSSRRKRSSLLMRRSKLKKAKMMTLSLLERVVRVLRQLSSSMPRRSLKSSRRLSFSEEKRVQTRVP